MKSLPAAFPSIARSPPQRFPTLLPAGPISALKHPFPSLVFAHCVPVTIPSHRLCLENPGKEDLWANGPKVGWDFRFSAQNLLSCRANIEIQRDGRYIREVYLRLSLSQGLETGESSSGYSPYLLLL